MLNGWAQKRIASEFPSHSFWVNCGYFIFHVKTMACSKAQSFGGKAKWYFHPKMYRFAAWRKFEWGGWCRTKHRVSRLYGHQTKRYCLRFASARPIRITGHLIGVKEPCKFCWYVKFSRLCKLRRTGKKIRPLKILFVKTDCFEWIELAEFCLLL